MTPKRVFFQLLFLAYLAVLLYFLFFSEEYGRTNTQGEYHYNLELFREIRRFWEYRDVIGWKPMLVNILGNVLAFVPLGFMLPTIWEGWRHWYLIVPFGFMVSLLVEMIQLTTKVGTFDVDDLLLNSVGAWIGYVLFFIVYRSRRNRS